MESFNLEDEDSFWVDEDVTLGSNLSRYLMASVTVLSAEAGGRASLLGKVHSDVKRHAGNFDESI